jgi:hypothetical protein
MPSKGKKGKKTAATGGQDGRGDDSESGDDASDAPPPASPGRRAAAKVPTTPRPRGLSKSVSRVFLLRVKEPTCLWMVADPALVPDDENDDDDERFGNGEAFTFCTEMAVVVQGVVTSFCVAHSLEAVARRKLFKTPTSVDAVEALTLWKLFGLDCACKNPSGCSGAVGVDQACCATCERSAALLRRMCRRLCCNRV